MLTVGYLKWNVCCKKSGNEKLVVASDALEKEAKTLIVLNAADRFGEHYRHVHYGDRNQIGELRSDSLCRHDRVGDDNAVDELIGARGRIEPVGLGARGVRRPTGRDRELLLEVGVEREDGVRRDEEDARGAVEAEHAGGSDINVEIIDHIVDDERRASGHVAHDARRRLQLRQHDRHAGHGHRHGLAAHAAGARRGVRGRR